MQLGCCDLRHLFVHLGHMVQSHSTDVEHVLWSGNISMSVKGASDQVIRLNISVATAWQARRIDASKHVQAVIQYGTATPKVVFFGLTKPNTLIDFKGPFPVKL